MALFEAVQIPMIGEWVALPFLRGINFVAAITPRSVS